VIAKEGKYLTFQIDVETYGIPIEKVKEIIGIMNITKVPGMPKYVKGVINLRGNIIPLIDLRLKFDMDFKEYNDRTCVIVVEMQNKEEKKLMGIAVDNVSEVINLEKDFIAPPPSYNSDYSSEYITGMGKLKEIVVILLDIERILSQKEKTILDNMEVEKNV